MNDEFATAMRRSLDLTRAGNLTEATRQIQEALGGNAAAFDTAPKADTGRSPLGKTVDDLRKRSKFGVKMPGAGLGAKPVAVPEGASFETRQYNGPQGARAYRLYVPSCGADKVRGLVVMLHGCTQNPEDFAAGTTMNTHAEAHDLLVAYPEQTRGNNANLCWNWFEPGHQAAGRGEPAILAGIALEIATEFKLPERRVFAAGLSAGGAMAALLGALHPETFSAVGVHSGLPPKAAQDIASAFAAMQGSGQGQGTALECPAIIFHGLADHTVAPVNAGRITGTILAAERTTSTEKGRRCQITKGETTAANPIELWLIEGAGHAWSGGSAAGSYTDTGGPDASAEMIRFFNAQMDT